MESVILPEMTSNEAHLLYFTVSIFDEVQVWESKNTYISNKIHLWRTSKGKELQHEITAILHALREGYRKLKLATNLTLIMPTFSQCKFTHYT